MNGPHHAGSASGTESNSRMRARLLGLTASLGIAIGTAWASATVAVPGEPKSCLPAAAAMTATLPELVSDGRNHRWRGLPVTIDCDQNGDVRGFAVEWRAGASGLLLDARSAISALGARLTGDTASSVTSALEKCIARSQQFGDPVEAEVARFVLTCQVTAESATLSVRKRTNR